MSPDQISLSVLAAGAAVALGVWAANVKAHPYKTTPTPPFDGKEIFGADEALRRWQR